MNRAYVIAALLGLATSASVASWSGSKSLVDTSHFTAEIYHDCDAGWETFYEAQEADPMDGWHSETYGVRLYSYLSATLVWTGFNTYEWSGELYFAPATITPYKQKVIYHRPEAGDRNGGPLFEFTGSRNVELLQLTTSFTENAKTFTRSFVDWFNDMNNYNIIPNKGDWIIDEDTESSYDDAYWTYDLWGKLVNDAGSWYGENNYFDKYVY